MKVIQVDIDSVNPASYNPRAISDEAFQGLLGSIRRFGVVRSLVVNRRTGNLVSGHQTLKACRQLGHKTVPVIYVELDDAMEKALNVTLNNPHIGGHYTDDLQGLIREIRDVVGDSFLDEVRLDDLVVNGDWYDEARAKDTAEGVEGYNEDEDGFQIKIDGVKPRDKDDTLAKVQAALEGSGYVAKVY